MKGMTTRIGLSRVRMMPTTEPRENAITQAADATEMVHPSPSAIQRK
jgi:hypothetical protein